MIVVNITQECEASGQTLKAKSSSAAVVRVQYENNSADSKFINWETQEI